MKLVSKDISHEALGLMTVEEQNKLLCQYAKLGDTVKEKREEFAEGAKVAGKLLCHLGSRLERGIAAHAIPANRTLKEEYKAITGVAPTTHAYTFSNVFGALVLSGKMPEAVYDDNPGNPLSITGQIVNAVLELPEGNSLDHPIIAKACAELARPTGKEKASILKALLATVKPAAKMTDKEALDLITEITREGKLGLVLVQVPDLFQALPEGEQKSVYTVLLKDDGVIQRMEKQIGAEKTSDWMAEVSPAPNTIRVIRPVVPSLEAAFPPTAEVPAAPEPVAA